MEKLERNRFFFCWKLIDYSIREFMSGILQMPVVMRFFFFFFLFIDKKKNCFVFVQAWLLGRGWVLRSGCALCWVLILTARGHVACSFALTYIGVLHRILPSLSLSLSLALTLCHLLALAPHNTYSPAASSYYASISFHLLSQGILPSPHSHLSFRYKGILVGSSFSTSGFSI
jgi:hypothetical protein